MKVITALSVAAMAFLPEVLADSLRCTTGFGQGLGLKPVPTVINKVTEIDTIWVTKNIQHTVTEVPTKTRTTHVDVTNTRTRTKYGKTVTIESTNIVTTTVPTTIYTTKTKTVTANTKTVTGKQTTTIAAKSGFVPAASALANVHQKRDVVRRAGRLRPTAVRCVKKVHKTVTRTRRVNKHDATVFARPKTVIVTHTDKHTMTKTVTGKKTTKTHTVKQIKTQTSTSTKVGTTTVTTTPVATVQPKIYAACAASNLLDYTYSFVTASSSNSTAHRNATSPASGPTTITHVGIGAKAINAASANHVYTIKNSNAYACCAACISGDAKDDQGKTITNCVGSVLGSDKVCTVYGADKCTAQSSNVFGDFYAQKSGPTTLAVGKGLTVSNGYCGEWSYGS